MNGFQWHDKRALKFVFDELHIVHQGKPDIVEHIMKENLLHLAMMVIFGDGRFALFLARFLVRIELGLFNQAVIDRQRNIPNMIQGGDGVDAFGAVPFGVVIVPSDAVVHDNDPVVRLDLTDIRFHRQPQVLACLACFRQKALNPTMTDRAM